MDILELDPTFDGCEADRVGRIGRFFRFGQEFEDALGGSRRLLQKLEMLAIW